ncbi:MAG: DUF3775 domain-containing protein [Sphingomonadales bacterium]
MLGIDPVKVGFIIVKAREFFVKGAPVPCTNPLDDDERQILHDYVEDANYEELKDAIDQLNVEEQYNLVALMWLGRGSYSNDEWRDAIVDARAAHSDHTADYLLGTPLLPDYLEEGLSQLGFSLEDVELG